MVPKRRSMYAYVVRRGAGDRLPVERYDVVKYHASYRARPTLFAGNHCNSSDYVINGSQHEPP